MKIQPQLFEVAW